MAVVEKEKKKKVVQTNTVDLDILRKDLKAEVISMDENFEYFLTGNPMFDAFVGSGGLPKYQLEYIWATSSVGKSTLAIQILASYIKQCTAGKYIVLYFDTEESITPNRLKSLGIPDVNLITILNPNTIERVGEILQAIRAKYKDIDIFVIWDTIAQTPSAEEIDGYQKIGMQARALTSLFRTTRFYTSKLTMLALNQYRESMEANSKYLPKEPPGGNAVKHKSFLTLFGSRKKSELVEPDFGYVSTLQTIKSKIISPKRKFDFEFTNISGYDSVLTAINFLRTNKLMGKKDGGKYFFVDEPDKNLKLHELYNWFLTDEAVPRWKMIITEMYQKLYPDDDLKFIEEGKARIFNYYFEGDKVHIDRFTSLTSKLMTATDSVDIDADISNIIDTLDNVIDDEASDSDED